MIRISHDKAIQAYKALGNVCKMPFRLGDARKLCTLHRKLQEEAEFHDQELSKLLRRYPSERKQNGDLSFAFTEDKEAFEKAYGELMAFPVEIDGDPVVIRTEDYQKDDLRIPPEDLLRLEGFLELQD